MENAQEDPAAPSRKIIGRPRGSKDSKPRQRRRPHIDKIVLSEHRHGLCLIQGPAEKNALRVSRCDYGKTVTKNFVCSDVDQKAGPDRDINESSLRRTYPFFLQF